MIGDSAAVLSALEDYWGSVSAQLPEVMGLVGKNIDLASIGTIRDRALAGFTGDDPTARLVLTLAAGFFAGKVVRRLVG